MRLHCYIFSTSETVQQISIKYDVDIYTESCSVSSFWHRPLDLTFKNFSLWNTRSLLITTGAYALNEKPNLMLCWPCIMVYQHSETNVMHFLFSLLRIKGLDMFRALLAHPPEVLNKRQLVYCVRVMSVGCANPGAANWHNTDKKTSRLAHCALYKKSNDIGKYIYFYVLV
jgi:hypothetical protein